MSPDSLCPAPGSLQIPALLLLGNVLWFGFQGSVHFPGDPERVFCARTVSSASEMCRTCCSLQGVCPHTSKNSYVQRSWVPHEHRHLFLLGKAFFLPVWHIMEYMSPSQAFYQRKLKYRASETGVSKRGQNKMCPKCTRSN